MMLIGGPAAVIALVALGQLVGAARPRGGRKDGSADATGRVAPISG
jgi:hypothetical protein